MRWQETVASRCRYGDVAERIFGESEIIWEDSEDDYQGRANILAYMPDKTFIHYMWTYGSCSGCDKWEAAFDSNKDKVEQEMRKGLGVLPDVKSLIRYLRLEDEEAKIPTSNSSTNGSVPGMLYLGFGGFGESFEKMRKAAFDWLLNNKLVEKSEIE